MDSELTVKQPKEDAPKEKTTLELMIAYIYLFTVLIPLLIAFSLALPWTTFRNSNIPFHYGLVRVYFIVITFPRDATNLVALVFFTMLVSLFFGVLGARGYNWSMFLSGLFGITATLFFKFYVQIRLLSPRRLELYPNVHEEGLFFALFCSCLELLLAFIVLDLRILNRIIVRKGSSM